MALSARLLTLRRSPFLLKLPPYLSAALVVVGIAWLLLLPLDEYSRQTYVSENAILPGQVHTHFGGSEHNVFRAYRQEVFGLGEKSEAERVAGLGRILQENGLKVANQSFQYRVAGEEIAGTNVYGILQGPRADATEAMVLVAAWRNFEGVVNYSGVALAFSLARYFSRWSIWSKDIIVLIPSDSTYGPIAWVDAYHSTSMSPTSAVNISALPIKAGALQAAVALDYPAGPWGQRFDKLDIIYDGINGALPNLDLLNTAVTITSSQMGVGCTLHKRSQHTDSYTDRLRTLAAGVVTQGTGHVTGPHSAFMSYHVDAITLKTTGDGWHDEMTLGRATESLFRSINNLLEHLHQSFFFYMLMNANRFVSIGSYLPSAMVLAASLTITALALWVQSGRAAVKSFGKSGNIAQKATKPEMEIVKEGKDIALIPKAETEVVERKLFLPAVAVLGVHLAGFVPLYLLSHVQKDHLSSLWPIVQISAFGLAPTLSALLVKGLKATPQQFQLLQAFSLLLLGATLSMIATLNFSLAWIIGLLASPLSFVRPLPNPFTTKTHRTGLTLGLDIAVSTLSVLVWAVVSPPAIVYFLKLYFKQEIAQMLFEAAKGWIAQGAWTSFVVWGIWWPAWVIGGTVLFSGWLRSES